MWLQFISLTSIEWFNGYGLVMESLEGGRELQNLHYLGTE